MAVKRKVYTPEFKLAAVKMIPQEELSVAEVARRLGVPESASSGGQWAMRPTPRWRRGRWSWR